MLEALYQEINTNYAIQHTSALVTRLWWVPAISICFYLAFIVLGRQWMKNTQPYGLRKLLFLWNVVLAIFSISGAWVMLPSPLEAWYRRGLAYSVCQSTIYEIPLHSFYSMLFVFSKIVEFGDTFFVVMRKTPLNFLHWYHHITVCVFSWHSLAMASSPAHWFCALNFAVHSVMYTYYAIKSTGVSLPKFVAVGITMLQLLQFVMGLIVVCTSAYVLFVLGQECRENRTNITMGVVIYFSYIVLFGNFFYQRYLKPKEKAI